MPSKFMLITVDKSEVAECLKFAVDFVCPTYSKSRLDFGNSSIPRNDVDRIADCAVGKIGELAFKKLCISNGLSIELDFKLNAGRHAIDFGQDIETVEVDGEMKPLLPLVDIKTTKNYGSWLLLEEHKFWASVVVLMSVKVPGNIESDLTPFNNDISCEFKGYAFFSDFFDPTGNPWFDFFENSHLVSPKAVAYMYESAINKYGTITSKKQLLDFSGACKEKFGDDFFIKSTKLKCPHQIGLPVSFLRKSNNELKLLVDLLRATTIPQSAISDSLKCAFIQWNKYVSQLDRRLELRD